MTTSTATTTTTTGTTTAAQTTTATSEFGTVLILNQYLSGNAPLVYNVGGQLQESIIVILICFNLNFFI